MQQTQQKWQNNGAGPIQCKRFNDAWGKIRWEHNTWTELSGVIGVSEQSATLASLGGSTVREDVTAAQERIGARFNWTITAQNVNDAIKMMGEELSVLQQNRPVKDERKTPEVEAARTAELNRTMAEQRAKSDEKARKFVQQYGNGEKVTVQPGQMAVVAKVCFDNSDSMTDYFDRHATLSQAFALLVVPKQAETKRLARRGVAVSALLSGLAFEWHTEKYSMGHGNYLEGGGFELPSELAELRSGYRGTDVTHAHWEVSFVHAYRDPVSLDGIAGYGQTPTGGDSPTAATPGPVAELTISENAEKDGIEIRFPGKPSAAVLDSLKTNGWRWSRFSQCWYTRRSERARQFAEVLGGKSAAAQAEEGGASQAQAVPTVAPPAPSPRAAASSRSKSIPDDVLDVLRQASFDADSVQLNGRLDRDLYLKVNKFLEMAGGKWNRGRKCHVFAQNPRGVLRLDDAGDGSGTVEQGALSDAAITAMVERGDGSAAVWQLFPTPPEVVARMIDEARIREGDTVLEPSAGTGNIADAVRFDFPLNRLQCVEINQSLAVGLLTKGHQVAAGDFLAQNGNLGKFDVVLMNPPFENGADIKHIQHARGFLKPGGRLVALCANGPRQREALQPLAETWEELPKGAFKGAGTMVSAVMLTIRAED